MASITRPVTLFTGQWADLPFEEVCRLAGEWGYDGLEIACWGDHLDADRGATDDAYIADRKAILEKNGLQVFAISNHLKGQAVCDDPIDQRHRDMLPDSVWGDGDPEGVRQRAAEELKNTARTAARLGAATVTGFTGSSIWKYVAMFPPVRDELVEAGYQDFADRWNPILDVFEEVGVRFALEPHPSRDRLRLLDDVAHPRGHRPPQVVRHQLGPVAHGLAGSRRGRLPLGLPGRSSSTCTAKTRRSACNGRNGRLQSHLPWADPRRGWDFISTGHGDVPWEDAFRMLNAIGYTGPLSVEWEDAGMDRLVGAPEALEFVRGLSFPQPSAAFDAAFATSTTTQDQ